MPSYETDQPIVVTIDMSQGMVHVVADHRTDSVVAVNPSDRNRAKDVEAARSTVVDFTNGNLSIRTPRPRGIANHLGTRRIGSVDLVVEVPEGSALTATCGFVDVRCVGRLGDVQVKTGAGNVRLDRTGTARVTSGAGHVSIEEASGSAELVTAGDITVDTVVGDAHVKNLNGKTWINLVGGSAKVRSANGDVTIGAGEGDASVKTANGDIRLGRVSRGTVTVETANGGLEIGVEEGTAAWVDASTRFGRVLNTLSASEHPEQSTDVAEIRARTAFGDVLITRAEKPRRS